MADERSTILIDVEVNTEDTAQKLGEVVKEISELRTEQKNLTKELQESDEVDAEKARRLAEVQNELKRLKNEQKEYTSILQNESSVANSYGDSLDEQRRKLSDMQKAYDSLSASWRDSSAGQAFKKQLDDQYNSVLELEQATGRHQRNVGNYPNVVADAVPALGQLDGALNKMGTSVDELALGGGKAFTSIKANAIALGKAFLTPPIAIIVAVLSAIMLASQKVSEAFKKNDTASTNLDRAFSKLQPISTAISKAFNFIAESIGEVVLGFANLIGKAGEWLEAVGLLPKGFSEASKSAEELVIATDNLEQAERDYAVNSAKRQRDIAELRAKATEADKYSAKERQKMLEDAIALEQQNLDEEYKIAEERVRILKETAKQNVDTSDETANEIAKAEADLYKAQETYYSGTRRLQAQLVATRKEIASEQIKINEAEKAEQERISAEEAKRAEEELRALEERENKKNEILRIAKQTAINLIENESERARVLELDRYEQEIEEMQQRYAELGVLTEEEELAKYEHFENLKREHLARMAEIEDEAKLIAEEKKAEEEEKAYEEALERAATEEEKLAIELEREQAHHDELVRMTQEEIALKFASQEEYERAVLESEGKITNIQDQQYKARLQKAQNTMNSINSIIGSMSSIMNAFDNESKESAIAQKALALGEIAVNTGVAIAQGISSAMSVPFPANLAAIATTIATIVANIATAVSTVKSAKFATGGIVGGSNYSGDNVPIQVNSGEMVLNRNQQKNLFEIANTGQVTSGFDYDLLALKMTDAIKQLPAPILDYAEFTAFQERVISLDEQIKL